MSWVNVEKKNEIKNEMEAYYGQWCGKHQTNQANNRILLRKL